MRRTIRRVLFFPVDFVTTFFRQPLVPPRGLRYTGAGDFVEIGNKFLKAAVTHCGLAPSSRVLDIGCGIGRIARPLTTFLGNDGSYHGFDIVADGIKWCTFHYRKFHHFEFRHFNLKNDLYNLGTSNEASSFVFPYENSVYHMVFAISVFTHMQPDVLKQYLHEVSRVLKADGYMLCTFFLLSNNADGRKTAAYRRMFPYSGPGCRLHNLKVKDANVAYEENAIRYAASEADMDVSKIFVGWWSDEANKNDCFDYQDVIILKKRSV
jgi:cyclopropane fatty-acyl-phospholipid synthase-like methyltransferase